MMDAHEIDDELLQVTPCGDALGTRAVERSPDRSTGPTEGLPNFALRPSVGPASGSGDPPATLSGDRSATRVNHCTTRDLRAIVLEQTLRVLRRRRRVRRALYALSLAGCYLAGAATIGLLRPSSAEGQAGAAVAKRNAPTLVADSEQSSADPAVVMQPMSAVETTSQASVAVAERVVKPSHFASYCALGDLNLTQRRDHEAAARAYRVALRYANEEERAWSATEGTWLMRAIQMSLVTHTSTHTDDNTYDAAKKTL